MPTANASITLRSTANGPGPRDRSPTSTSAIVTSRTAVLACATIPVSAPTTRTCSIEVSGLAVRTASLATPSAARSRRTTFALPALATTPSSPPEIRSPVAVKPLEPRSTRTAVPVSCTVNRVSATCLPPIDTPTTRAPVTELSSTVTPVVDFSITSPRRPPEMCARCTSRFVVPTWVNMASGWSTEV